MDCCGCGAAEIKSARALKSGFIRGREESAPVALCMRRSLPFSPHWLQKCYYGEMRARVYICASKFSRRTQTPFSRLLPGERADGKKRKKLLGWPLISLHAPRQKKSSPTAWNKTLDCVASTLAFAKLIKRSLCVLIIRADWLIPVQIKHVRFEAGMECGRCILLLYERRADWLLHSTTLTRANSIAHASTTLIKSTCRQSLKLQIRISLRKLVSWLIQITLL